MLQPFEPRSPRAITALYVLAASLLIALFLIPSHREDRSELDSLVGLAQNRSPLSGLIFDAEGRLQLDQLTNLDLGQNPDLVRSYESRPGPVGSPPVNNPIGSETFPEEPPIEFPPATWPRRTGSGNGQGPDSSPALIIRGQSPESTAAVRDMIDRLKRMEEDQIQGQQELMQSTILQQRLKDLIRKQERIRAGQEREEFRESEPPALRVGPISSSDIEALLDACTRQSTVPWISAAERRRLQKKCLELRRDLEKLKAKEALKKEKPQIWKRSAKRPTFARVDIGNGNTLELVSLRVSVVIDGPRARTLVDHVFRNPHDRQLEGTFEYPLPSGARPSYFGMFLGHTRGTIPALFPQNVNGKPLPQEKLAQMTPAQVVKHIDTEDWGRLQEGRVVSKQRGLETYESIVRQKIDPALLEHAGGNSFRGRVFPIPANGYNRVLIAYEELLPWSGNQNVYRYPLPDCKLASLEFSLQAQMDDLKDAQIEPKDAEHLTEAGLHTYNKTWKEKGPGGQVVFSFAPSRPDLQVISGSHQGSKDQYVFARIKPQLQSEQSKPYSQRAIFLLDTSLSENPDRFAVNMRLMEEILKNDSEIKQFNILLFSVGNVWLNPKGWLTNDHEGREKAFNQLDGILLEGATDWSAALRTVAQNIPGLDESAPVNVFVLSDGQATWGNRDISAMASAFELQCRYRPLFHCYRTGLGAENLELYQALTRRGGAIFNCFTVADLRAAGTAHRKHCWQIEHIAFSGPSSDVLVAGRQVSLYPGGELLVTGCLSQMGKTTLRVEGTFLGKPMAREYSLQIDGESPLAQRAWGEVAVQSLLALNNPKHDELVTAYCQQFNIGSKVASFLVLENEADYKKLDLQKERGKTVKGDLADFMAQLWREMGKPLTARESLDRFLARIGSRIKLFEGNQGTHVNELLKLLSDNDLSLPEATVRYQPMKLSEVPLAYRMELRQSQRTASSFIKEAMRRLRYRGADVAIQGLSSIVEDHPGRSDALRLVGYRLMAFNQPAHAVQLFDQVQRQRPFEPHSYRDLARSLEQCNKAGLAALQYELVLSGTWDDRFGGDLKPVVQEEYARMMRQAISQGTVKGTLADYFGERLEKLTKDLSSDLQVTITWNTDATDIDLWVIEPDGTKCFYSHSRTKNGGELTQDLTNGYGPERYQIKSAKPGAYRIMVHYYRSNPNLIGGETHVDVVVTQHSGTKKEKIQRQTAILKKDNDIVELKTVNIK